MNETEEVTAVSEPVGARLQAAREAQGLTLDDVAAKTRVPIRHLIHMEKGEWDALPARTYSVGFARAYATAVGLNASAIGAELRAELGAVPGSVAAAHYEPADPARVPPRWLAAIAVVLMIALVGGYLLWRNQAVGEAGVDQAEIASLDTPDQPQAAAPKAAAAPAPQASGGPVVLTATDDVWLRVYEAGGRKLFENTLKRGQRFEVPATAARPQILTGRPNALQVTVGGAPVPTLGPPERTIADVSLLAADLLRRSAAPSPAASPPAGR